MAAHRSYLNTGPFVSEGEFGIKALRLDATELYGCGCIRIVEKLDLVF
ncbi:hypothetical protein [Candidatus Tisiphia endosymbiont of Nemotelus uliginosus]